MKPKSNTYLDKLRLTDTDLRTPKHDELCLWVNENYKKLFSKFIDSEEYIAELKRYGCYLDNTSVENLIDYLEEQLKDEYTNKEEINLELNYLKNKSWEQQTCDYCGQIYYKFTLDKEGSAYSSRESHVLRGYCNQNHSEFHEYQILWEQPIKSGSYFIGHVDFIVIISDKLTGKIVEKFLIEVKPSIKSIGELFRQINTYRSCSKGKMVVVTETKGLKELFQQQDVIIIEKTVNDAGVLNEKS